LARPGALRGFERRRQPLQLALQPLALRPLDFLGQIAARPFQLRVVATQSSSRPI
jgi:hypothetical protein